MPTDTNRTSRIDAAENDTNPSLASALQAAELRFTAANPKSDQRYHDAAAVLPGGNTRSSLFYSPFPVTFANGEGQHLTDVDGHVYTDFLGEYSAGLYGHSHPKIMEAARAALDVGVALGGPNQFEAELAALIEARFPSIDLLRFTNSGTEANLLAIATARAVTGRSHILVFENGYHGSVLSFRGSPALNAPYPFVIGTYNDVDGTRAQLEQYKDELAAVLVEPVLGGGGVIPGSPEFLHALRDSTAKLGVLLIFDEVMTSRLSPGGVQTLYGIRPDLTTLGKYVGGGFSFGAFGGTHHLMERYDPARIDSLSHPGTFNNNVISMAAGAVGLSEVFTPDVAVAHNARGDELRERLNMLFVEKLVAMQATGIGSLIGIHYQKAPIITPSDVVPAERKQSLVHLEMIARGYYFARRGYLSLSLALDQRDVDGFVEALGEVIDEYVSLLRTAGE